MSADLRRVSQRALPLCESPSRKSSILRLGDELPYTHTVPNKSCSVVLIGHTMGGLLGSPLRPWPPTPCWRMTRGTLVTCTVLLHYCWGRQRMAGVLFRPRLLAPPTRAPRTFPFTPSCGITFPFPLPAQGFFHALRFRTFPSASQVCFWRHFSPLGLRPGHCHQDPLWPRH